MFDGDLLTERARVTPEQLALVSVATGERFTYAELDARADQAADTIAGARVRPGDRFGILALNCTEYVDFFFGAGRTGAIVVPLSTRATVYELENIIRDCGMRVLFVGEEFAALAAELPVECFPLRASEAPIARVRVAANGEDTYCLLYTSGTTGKPKGVMLPRRQLLWNGYNTVVSWDLRADDVTPVFTPLCHAGGLAAFLIPVFCAGGTVVLHKSFDVAEVWRVIEQERCTVVLGVPTIWKLLLEAPELESADLTHVLTHVRWFISGGAPLPAYLIGAYAERGITMKQGYGLTEVGVNCFTMTAADARRKPGSIGKAMLFTETRLVDGELQLRGPHVSQGYWNNPEATRASYDEDGWFHTGDLARCDDEGFFYISGRRKEMFISGGLNVYPAEVEAEILTHPRVRDAAVIGVPDDTWGESGVAFIVGDVSGDTLNDHLAARLSKYKVPRRYIFVDALPRTPYGKVLKEELSRRLRP
jgi:fatty-acyl-CoA synthase